MKALRRRTVRGVRIGASGASRQDLEGGETTRIPQRLEAARWYSDSQQFVNYPYSAVHTKACGEHRRGAVSGAGKRSACSTLLHRYRALTAPRLDRIHRAHPEESPRFPRVAVMPSQQAADTRKKRILGSAGKVCVAQGQGIAATTPGATDHQMLRLAAQMRDERCLHKRLVDSIHNPMTARRNACIEVVRGKKSVVQLQPNPRADIRKTLRHRLDLGHAEGGVQGMHLPVEIGQGNMVHVDQAEGAHA